MKTIKKFNNYLEDLLLENISDKDIPFILSDRLVQLLMGIDHPISKELLSKNNKLDVDKITLIDYDDVDSVLFTFSPNNKILDYIISQTNSTDYDENMKIFKKPYYNNLFNMFRVPIRIGKFIKRLFNDKFESSGKPGQDIESFINSIKSERDLDLSNEKIFEIVKGNDILKYYLETSYSKNKGKGDTLHYSCMKYKKCQTYLEFYVINDHKVNMIIMKDSDGLIKGRALLWDIDLVDNNKVNRKFMDRVYVEKYTDIEKFIKYAKYNNYLFKETQSSNEHVPIIDPETGNKHKIISVYNIKKHKSYPYMDTFKYFDTDNNILSNSDDNGDFDFNIFLQSTTGGFENIKGDNYSYDEYTDQILLEDDLTYCRIEDLFTSNPNVVYSEFDDTFLTPTYAEENYKYSEIEEDWIPNKYAVHVNYEDVWVSLKFAENSDYMYCVYDGEWYQLGDTYPSWKWDCVPYDKVVTVILTEDIDLNEPLEPIEIDGEYTDNRYEGDGTYFEVKNKKDTFYLDEKLKGKPIVNKIKKGDY